MTNLKGIEWFVLRDRTLENIFSRRFNCLIPMTECMASMSTQNIKNFFNMHESLRFMWEQSYDLPNTRALSANFILSESRWDWAASWDLSNSFFSDVVYCFIKLNLFGDIKVMLRLFAVLVRSLGGVWWSFKAKIVRLRFLLHQNHNQKSQQVSFRWDREWVCLSCRW